MRTDPHAKHLMSIIMNNVTISHEEAWDRLPCHYGEYSPFKISDDGVKIHKDHYENSISGYG